MLVRCWTDAGEQVGMQVGCWLEVESEVAGYAEGLVTVSEGTGAALCDVAPCGAAPCGVSPDDTAP